LAAETIARVVIRGPSNSISEAENFRVFPTHGRVDAHMVSIFAQRVLPLAVLAVATVSVPFLMLSPTGLPRLRNLEEERRKANEEISRLGSQIAGLRAEVARIKSDPAAVERAARDELGLVRTTEVVFQFSE
jgi:cell division protein FtsB